MGIHGLSKLLQEECPGAIKEHEVILNQITFHTDFPGDLSSFFTNTLSWRILLEGRLQLMHRWQCISFLWLYVQRDPVVVQLLC